VSELVSETVPSLPVVKEPIALPLNPTKTIVAPPIAEPPTESKTMAVISVEVGEVESDEETAFEQAIIRSRQASIQPVKRDPPRCGIVPPVSKKYNLWPILSRQVWPSEPNSNKRCSGKPGAVHCDARLVSIHLLP
jgi:hypothetical protein